MHTSHLFHSVQTHIASSVGPLTKVQDSVKSKQHAFIVSDMSDILQASRVSSSGSTHSHKQDVVSWFAVLLTEDDEKILGISIGIGKVATGSCMSELSCRPSNLEASL